MHQTEKIIQNSVNQETQASETSLSKSLLVNNVVFLLTNSPAILSFIMIRVRPEEPISTGAPTREIIESLNNINYAVNFVLYFVAGSMFRKVGKSLFIKNM